jgi:hypothetical protein
MLLTEIPDLDAVLRAHASELGADFTGYRNHAYRVVNLCTAIRPADGEASRKLAIAAAFHDLGIWTERTFDYLGPSVELSCAHLAALDKWEWQPEVSRMILEHHRISRYREQPESLVEPFRQADWIDVSHGLLSFGLPRKVIRQVFAAWPDAGFHRKLVQLSLRRLRTNPGNPLPMLKW